MAGLIRWQHDGVTGFPWMGVRAQKAIHTRCRSSKWELFKKFLGTFEEAFSDGVDIFSAEFGEFLEFGLLFLV